GGGGKFQLKAGAVGKLGPISLVPPNPGTSGCLLFEIGGGDRYHVLFGPGSTIKTNDAKTFVMKEPPGEGLCLPPCGSFLATWGSVGSGDGQFSFPLSVAVDGSGNGLAAWSHGSRRMQDFKDI